MNRSRLLMIGALALAIGFLVSISVYKNLKNASGTKDPGVEVMVAADDLQVGTKVDEHDVKIIRVASDAFPPGAPRRKGDVIGHGVIQPIYKGEFILPNHLAQENAGNGLPSLIPPGMRAVSVKVNEVVSVAGFVLPGTRVDVLLTGTPNGQGDEQTTTVLQNVAVLASGHTLERSPNGEAQTTAVITLLVTPDDAQRLTLASSSNGHIQLALRNPLDTKQEDVPPANSRALYKLAVPVAPAPVHAVPVHHVRPVIKDTPPPNQPVQVEVYQGDKRQDVKFPEEGPSTK